MRGSLPMASFSSSLYPAFASTILKHFYPDPAAEGRGAAQGKNTLSVFSCNCWEIKTEVLPSGGTVPAAATGSAPWQHPCCSGDWDSYSIWGGTLWSDIGQFLPGSSFQVRCTQDASQMPDAISLVSTLRNKGLGTGHGSCLSGVPSCPHLCLDFLTVHIPAERATQTQISQ